LPLFFYNTKSNELGLNTLLLWSSTMMNITKGGAHLDSMWNDVTGYGTHASESPHIQNVEKKCNLHIILAQGERSIENVVIARKCHYCSHNQHVIYHVFFWYAERYSGNVILTRKSSDLSQWNVTH
jgi:hypothetical protein